MPAWAALPAALITGSLLLALFGMLWDISIHIDNGRDEGPLANPAHYAILGGLFGVFAAGFLAMVMPKERPGPTAIRITGEWYAPIGGILIAACGAFSLVGFPLDDVWHRLFGQDVTLWGPTHLMLIGGASMTLIGLAVLLVEGSRAELVGRRPERGSSWARWVRNVALTGAFLLGLSTFQAEFDFGVPQFRFVFAPMLVMLAAGVVAGRRARLAGRGAAIGAALFFFAIRGGIALIVGPVLGETTPYFPLYLASAVVVELVALRVRSDARCASRSFAGRRHRHRGPRRGVGVVAGHDADPLAVRAPARGRLLGFAMAIAALAAGRLDGRAPGLRPPAAYPLDAARRIAARRGRRRRSCSSGSRSPPTRAFAGRISIASAGSAARSRGHRHRCARPAERR